MKKILASAFGINCKIEKTKVKGLALYMTSGREFFKVSMEGLVFLLVKISSNDRFGAVALEKQMGQLKATAGCEVAFYFDTLTKMQREALITRRIPFVAGAEQIYLPFLGIALRNNLKNNEKVHAEKMMPATQSLFLYLLYGKREYVLKKQAAEDLGLTRTSITRASEQLKVMGLISEETHGKEVHMRTVSTGYELYRAAKAYLVSPVQKRIFVSRSDVSRVSLPIAGESALSRTSMLGEPRHDVFAISKNNGMEEDFNEINIQWQEDTDVVQLELWKYNPVLFAKDGIVDPVSLALSLGNKDDERVQSELQTFMEKYEW